MTDTLTRHDIVQAEQRIHALFLHAQQQLEQTFTLPRLTWKKSGKNAGTANLTTNVINLNRVLYVHNRQAFLEHVIPHEVSHIVVHQRFGRVKPHGREWQYVMEQVFGVPAATTHQFDLSPLKLNTVTYYCECGPLELGIRRHNKVLSGEQSYRCRRCAQTLVIAK